MEKNMVLSNERITFYLSKSESEAVRYAVEDLCNDLNGVIGATTKYDKAFDIYIGNLENKDTRNYLDDLGLNYNDILSHEDGHKIIVRYDKCFILGNGELGTIYAIYEFSSSTLKVSPFMFWADNEYEKRQNVKVVEFKSVPFSFKLRAFAINDEDGLVALSPNGEKRYFNNDKFAIVPSSTLIVNACKLALRLKYNLFVPMTMLNILNPHEEDVVKCVTSRGLYITQNFYEPLGVSLNTWNYYWTTKNKEELKPSYLDNPTCFETIWKEYIKKWSSYKKVVYQLGLLNNQYDETLFYDLRKRGKINNFAHNVASIIDKQMQIVKEFLGDDAKFMLYKAPYLSYALKRKILSLSKNVTLVRKISSPASVKNYRRKRKEIVDGYVFSGINSENGTHLVQYPDTYLADKLLVLYKANYNHCVYLNVGNIRENIFNIYVFGKTAQHVASNYDVINNFCHEMFGTYALKSVYERIVKAYVRVEQQVEYFAFGSTQKERAENKVFTDREYIYGDALVMKVCLKILSLLKNKNRSRQIEYSDNFGVSLTVDLSAFLKNVENSMSDILQITCDIKNSYKCNKNFDYYKYSLYNQCRILFKLYSYMANLVRYKKFYDYKYIDMAIDDIENVKILVDSQMAGRWSGSITKTSQQIQNLIKQTKEI